MITLIQRFGSTATCRLPVILWERMLEEETQHFPRGVRSERISVGSRRAPSRPCVVRDRGFSSVQRFLAHSRRYESCGYRHARQVPARDAPSFACSAQEYDRRYLDAPCCRDHRERQWSGQAARQLELPCHLTFRLVAWRHTRREGQWRRHRRGQNVCRLRRTDRGTLLP
jgi:hypothetical protein